MIEAIVKNWEKNKRAIQSELEKAHPEDYKSLVSLVVKYIKDINDYTELDFNKIHEIDDGDYEGTLLYIIPEKTYQPFEYWAVKVGYGSCSGCDTLDGIREYGDETPSKNQVSEYMTLCLHIVQGISKIGGEIV